MARRVNYRTIWRINAWLILVGGLGAAVMLGYTGLNIVQVWLLSSNRTDVVNVEPDVEVQWRLGTFERASTTGYMFAPVYSSQSASMSSKVATATRNILFVNAEDKSTRWLIPNHNSLILATNTLAANGETTTWTDAAKPVKWMVVQVVSVDVNRDRRLTNSDRATIAVANADGSQYAEVLRGVEEVLGEQSVDGQRLLVFYAANGRNHAAEIDLAARKVLSTKELPKISQP